MAVIVLNASHMIVPLNLITPHGKLNYKSILQIRNLRHRGIKEIHPRSHISYVVESEFRPKSDSKTHTPISVLYYPPIKDSILHFTLSEGWGWKTGGEI